jgi:YidC/Oxa1 family membrane protein insertase
MSFNNNGETNSRNLIIVLALFMVLIFAHDRFFGSSETEKQKDEKSEKLNITEKAENSAHEVTHEVSDLSIDDELSKESRVFVENEHMKGSINLDGSIIDSVVLKNYKETIDDGSKDVMLLTPRGTKEEFFYLISYLDNTNNEKVADETVWIRCISTDARSASLKTQTQNGIIIERRVTFDDQYLITIKDTITNTSDSDVKLLANSSLNRKNPKQNNYAVVHEGVVGNSLGKIEEIKYKDIENETNLRDCSWVGYTDIYWLCSIINKEKNSFNMSYLRTENDLYKISMKRKEEIKLASNASIELEYSLFTGPKDISVLNKYKEKLCMDKFEMAIDFGWFFIITKPLVQLMNVFAEFLPNMGLVILVLTLFFKFITYPLIKKSFVSAAKMRELQPKIAAIQKLYAHDKMRINQELIALYKKEGASPMSGCLPMILQAPIFFCLYKVFFINIKMRHAPLFGWIHDLSSPDSTYVFNMFGIIDWIPPGFLQIGIWPLIMGISMFLQQKLTTTSKSLTTEKTSEQKMQENMMLILPIMFTYICSSFPVGVVIYWTISNVFGILQQRYFNRKIKLQK